LKSWGYRSNVTNLFSHPVKIGENDSTVSIKTQAPRQHKLLFIRNKQLDIHQAAANIPSRFQIKTVVFTNAICQIEQHPLCPTCRLLFKRALG